MEGVSALIRRSAISRHVRVQLSQHLRAAAYAWIAVVVIAAVALIAASVLDEARYRVSELDRVGRIPLPHGTPHE